MSGNKEWREQAGEKAVAAGDAKVGENKQINDQKMIVNSPGLVELIN